MRSSENEQLIAGFRHVWRRRKRLLAASFVLAVAVAVAFNELATPAYQAVTTIVLEETAPAVSNLQVEDAFGRETRLANQLAEIQSYTISEAVTNALPAGTRDQLGRLLELGPGADVQRAVVSRIQESIAVLPLPNSNIVKIAIEMPDPETATLVANTLADVLRDKSLSTRQQGTSGTRAFIEEQLQRFSSQLAQADQNLMEFKQDQSLTSFDDESKEVLRRATEAEVLYNTAVANRRAAEDRLAAVQRELESQRRDLVPQVSDVGNTWAVQLKQKLVELQLQYQDLKVQGYADTHPKMAELTAQIDQTKANLLAEAQKLAASNITLDPLSQIDRYVNEAIGLRMEIAGLEAQETALQRVIATYNQRLSALPAKELNLARMTRDRDVSQKIYGMLQEKLQEARISEAEQQPGVRVIDRAQVPLEPTRPRKKVNLMLGSIFGVLLGFGLGLTAEAFGRSVDSASRFERLTGWRVLASIPRIERVSATNGELPATTLERRERRRRLRALVSHYDRSSGAAEAYRMLRTRLQLAGFGEATRVVLVTSMRPGEGKTTAVANLAVALADLGAPALVVDAEIRKPGMHEIFAVKLEPGLTDLLHAPPEVAARANDPAGAGPGPRVAEPAPAWREADPGASPPGLAAPEDARLLASVLQPTLVPNLSAVASGGTAAAGAYQTLSIEADRMRRFLASVRARFRYVVLDAPPLMLVHDVALMCSFVDGVVLVVDSRNLDAEMLADCKQTLESAKANVLGVVLNQVEPVGVYKKNSYYTT